MYDDEVIKPVVDHPLARRKWRPIRLVTLNKMIHIPKEEVLMVLYGRRRVEFPSTRIQKENSDADSNTTST